eukprot:scaffold223402_cov28-Tisochrysis_lutea.AAC.1
MRRKNKKRNTEQGRPPGDPAAGAGAPGRGLPLPSFPSSLPPPPLGRAVLLVHLGAGLQLASDGLERGSAPQPMGVPLSLHNPSFLSAGRRRFRWTGRGGSWRRRVQGRFVLERTARPVGQLHDTHAPASARTAALAEGTEWREAQRRACERCKAAGARLVR